MLPRERFSSVSDQVTQSEHNYIGSYLGSSPTGRGSEVYSTEDEHASTPERIISPKYQVRENRRTAKNYHSTYLSVSQNPTVSSSPQGSPVTPLEAPVHDIVRCDSPRHIFRGERQKLDPLPVGVDEPSLDFDELATSVNVFHRKINTTSGDEANICHLYLDKSPPTTQYVSEIHRSFSPTDPVDLELAEICARQVPQSLAECGHNGHLRGHGIVDSVCSMPVHLEESSDSEAIYTPGVDECRLPPCEFRAPVNEASSAEFENILSEAKRMHGKVENLENRAEPSHMPRCQNTKPLSRVSNIDTNGALKGDIKQYSTNRIHEIPAPPEDKPSCFSNTTPAVERHTPLIPVVSVTHKSASINQAQLPPDETTKVRLDGNTIEEAIFDVQEKVRFVCLGPFQDPPPDEHKSKTHSVICSGQHLKSRPSPIWIAICTGETTVSVYDFRTRFRLFTFRDHERSSNSPVIAILSFTLADQSVPSPETSTSKSLASQCSSEFLCVIQHDGQMTLCNIATNQIAGRLYVHRTIVHALPLHLVPTDLGTPGHSILAIDHFGAVHLCQWNLSPHPNDHSMTSSLCCDGQIHDLGTNIFDQLNKECHLPSPYVCCVCPCSESDPYSRTESPRCVPGPSKCGPVDYFYLAVAAVSKTDRCKPITLHLCCWVSIRQQLRTICNVGKQLQIDPNSALIGITYTEIAGAAALCVCLSSDAFWFSLKSLDIVSTLKLPTCAQPVNYLSPFWRHSYAASIYPSPQNERLWIAAKYGRVLEITAFESQRRRGASNRAFLLMLYISPCDSKVTSIVSASGEQDIMLVGTDKGEIHVIYLPNTYHMCEVSRCQLGFISQEDLIHHIVRDHYLSSCTACEIGGFQCNWPCCDFSLACSKRPIQIEVLEEHARQHLSVS